MRVRFPLIVKVGICLILNLLLLSAAAALFLVYTGGLNWNALMTGPSRRRLQTLADNVQVSLRLEPREEWDDILGDLSRDLNAEVGLYDEEARSLAGERMLPPPEVRRRMVINRPRARLQNNAANNETEARRLRLRDAIPPEAGPEPIDPRGRGIGIFRTTQPTAYWVAMRVAPQDNGPPHTLLIKVSSIGGLLRILDLSLWLWLGAGALALSIVFWVPFVRHLTRDLRRLTEATGEIAEGRFSARVTGRRSDEIGVLAVSINRMAERLDRLVNGQKKFLGDIAHELGSPLGRMQVATEILEDRVPENLRPAVSDVREEVEQMASLVAELLAFTRAGLQAKSVVLSEVNLSDIIDRVLAREAASDAVEVRQPENLRVLADADLLMRAVGNLVRNAIRYAGRDSGICIDLSDAGDHVVIRVQDEGPGVPPDTIHRLGEPFFRPEEARSRETGGAGLGLSIVKSCIEACQGEVIFSNRQPKGFCAEIRLKPGENAKKG